VCVFPVQTVKNLSFVLGNRRRPIPLFAVLTNVESIKKGQYQAPEDLRRSKAVYQRVKQFRDYSRVDETKVHVLQDAAGS
jgi:hypothetical protein